MVLLPLSFYFISVALFLRYSNKTLYYKACILFVVAGLFCLAAQIKMLACST
jgi:hypothetical protein